MNSITIATRAERLISQAAAEGRKHGEGFELGVLTGHVRNLCAELDAFKPEYHKGYRYIDHLELERGVFVSVGYTLGGGLDITEVWLNGAEVSDVIKPELLDSLRGQVQSMVGVMREDLAAEVA